MWRSFLERDYLLLVAFPQTNHFALPGFDPGPCCQVPTVLYSAYNNLSFLNLLALQPTAYHVLLNVRVLITALLSFLLLSTPISLLRLASLLLLAIGCSLASLKDGNIVLDLSTVAMVLLQGVLSNVPTQLLRAVRYTQSAWSYLPFYGTVGTDDVCDATSYTI
eukprot:2439717-Rhodomonas_salina.2